MPPAVLPAHAHVLNFSLKFHFDNVMESWRFCFVIFENSEGAVPTMSGRRLKNHDSSKKNYF
jgi:hypothetical protein